MSAHTRVASSWGRNVLLCQGRISWFDPNPAGEGEGEDGENAMDLDIYAIPAEPEIGPPLLATIAEDEPYVDEGEPAWTASLSSNTIPQVDFVSSFW